ncbi:MULTISPECIES: DUF2756 domain-containing protein [Dickeya]|uniref:DUF2756 domain-containing protein n=1 Tax=Dickeya oryzae TaxID=1240404 RepID=A0AB39IFX1_9GAMM|nr:MULTISPECIES: DUF2756 domain-containing protein [Dickeya]AJC68127.1 hypothetical protein W909_19410 [Dickeya zeae EC1]MBP2846171.1 DUF2756 domain-containing protein [Dickeya oryzae]MBP2849970.1 DUF2756 domain-containing protein [Dickeya oryzae]MBP2856105.1 DUF2756 domain-containing protein [Dickeya oryzae]MCA6990500.1 DUF2756 domain-containing protein [Dickeya oryzae]
MRILPSLMWLLSLPLLAQAATQTISPQQQQFENGISSQKRLLQEMQQSQQFQQQQLNQDIQQRSREQQQQLQQQLEQNRQRIQQSAPGNTNRSY